MPQGWQPRSPADVLCAAAGRQHSLTLPARHCIVCHLTPHLAGRLPFVAARTRAATSFRSTQPTSSLSAAARLWTWTDRCATLWHAELRCGMLSCSLLVLWHLLCGSGPPGAVRCTVLGPAALRCAVCTPFRWDSLCSWPPPCLRSLPPLHAWRTAPPAPPVAAFNSQQARASMRPLPLPAPMRRWRSASPAHPLALATRCVPAAPLAPSPPSRPRCARCAAPGRREECSWVELLSTVMCSAPQAGECTGAVLVAWQSLLPAPRPQSSRPVVFPPTPVIACPTSVVLPPTPVVLPPAPVVLVPTPVVFPPTCLVLPPTPVISQRLSCCPPRPGCRWSRRT